MKIRFGGLSWDHSWRNSLYIFSHGYKPVCSSESSIMLNGYYIAHAWLTGFHEVKTPQYAQTAKAALNITGIFNDESERT